MTLRIRLPLRITRHEESFGIKDHLGTNIAWVYFSETAERQQQTNRLSREDAEEVAKVIAKAVTERVERGEWVDGNSANREQTMLNEAQIEKAAREYCRLMGADPDERVTGASERHSTLAMTAPRWRFVARKVRDQAAMLAAIETARASAE